MRALQMVDTRTQYWHIKEEVDRAVSEVLDTAAYINGPAVGHFAEQLASYLLMPCR
jgi:dTDP-4-amino-4,6-dideoxygalactose transaminase